MTQNSLNDRTYQRIKNEIMEVILKPGDTVSVQKLADRYKISRTPVREAFVLLNQEGLLIIRPQSKTEIAKLSLPRIREEKFIKKALLVAAVKDFIKSYSQLTIDTLESMVAIMGRAIEKEKIHDFFEADKRFQRMLFHVSENDLAIDSVIQICTHLERLRYLSITEYGFSKDTLSAYSKIIEYAKKRDINFIQQAASELLDFDLNIDDLIKKHPNYFEIE